MNRTRFELKDRKVLLSTLWIFVTLNYLYADVISLMDTELLNQYLTGTVAGLQMTQSFLFGAAILMEIPIAMVLLSRILAYRANRWANMVAAFIKTAVMIPTLFVGTPKPYYMFFGVVEIACTALILWCAWTWSSPKTVTSASLPAA